MLHIESDNETPIDSKYYQSNITNSNLENRKATKKNYIPHIIENILYQSTTTKKQLTKRKYLNNSTSLRKPEKEKLSVTRPRN